MSIKDCIFTVENLAHLQGKESELLLLVEAAKKEREALKDAVEAMEKMKTSFEDLLNGYPERELHEPYQVTLNRANDILEKLK